MRKQEQFIIWPAYFDINKSREEGRRVAKNLAVISPRIAEVEDAATKLDLEHELIVDKGYPKTPWNRTGMLLVEKQGSKEQVIHKLAKQLVKARNEASPQQRK